MFLKRLKHQLLGQIFSKKIKKKNILELISLKRLTKKNLLEQMYLRKILSPHQEQIFSSKTLSQSITRSKTKETI
jgi:hypothetical protein